MSSYSRSISGVTEARVTEIRRLLNDVDNPVDTNLEEVR